MALNLGLSITFNLNTGKFNFTDDTDATDGSIYSKGVIKVTAPNGLDYFSFSLGNDESTFLAPATATTADFTAIDGLSLAISIPTSSGNPQIGLYTISYNAVDTLGNLYSLVIQLSYCHENPTAVITFDYDCFASSFTMTDDTNYTVDTIEPSISRILTLTYPNGIVNKPYDSYPAYVTNTSNATTIERTYNGVDGLFIGTYKGTLSTVLTYTYPSYTVTTAISGSSNVTTECSLVYCDVFCGIKSLEARYTAEKTKNTVLANQLREQLQSAMTYFEMYYHAYKCGDKTKSSAYANEVIAITGATTDCGCGCGGSTSSAPTVIVPFTEGMSTSGSTASSLLFSKVSFVDPTQGYNTTAVFGDFAHKFATIAKAISDSPSGYNIIPYAGTYSESGLGSSECVIKGEGEVTIDSGSSLLLDDTLGAITNMTIDVTTIKGSSYLIKLTNPSSIVTIKAKTIQQITAGALMIEVGNGAKLTIECDDLLAESSSQLIKVTGSSVVKIKANNFKCLEAGKVLEVVTLTGEVSVDAKNIAGYIYSNGSQTSYTKVSNAVIKYSKAFSVSDDVVSNLYLKNCTVMNKANNVTGYGLNVTTGVVLENSNLLVTNSGSTSIYSDSANNVLVVGVCNANCNKSANITIEAGMFNADSLYNTLLNV
jgi:hypothetical protein